MSNQKDTTGKIQNTEALAKHLGLSRWTISRVLNGHKGVKDTTVQRVFDAMDELGFAPNPMARGLRGGKTFMIGICFQELETPVLVKKTVVLQEMLRKRGYLGIMELTGNRIDLEENVIRNFLSLKVDGIVLVGSSLNPNGKFVKDLQQEDVPVIAVDAQTDVPFPRVTVDREHVYPLVLEHLYELGHRQFGIIGIHENVIYGKKRVRGIMNWAKSKGLDPEANLKFFADPDRSDLFYKYGADLGRAVLKEETPPTALVCLNDQLALGMVNYLVKAGKRVPEDFSVTGFDNLDVTKYFLPALTTIGQNINPLMQAGVDLLLPWIEDGKAPEVMESNLLPQLKIRESTQSI